MPALSHDDLKLLQYHCDKLKDVNRRLAELSCAEVTAVLNEAAAQFTNRDEGEDVPGYVGTHNIVDFLENALDMLASGDYCERIRSANLPTLIHRSEA